MTTDPTDTPIVAGPILYALGADDNECRLTALVVTREGSGPPPLTAEGRAAPVDPVLLAELFSHRVWSYRFALPARDGASYSIGERSFAVAADLRAETRIAFVSCNGQEHGDEDRAHADRDTMWRRLLDEHRRAPFALLIHGGDQLYADEAVGAHPALTRWSEADDDGKLAVPMTEEMHEALRRYFFFRYLGILNQPAAAVLYAQVPSLMIWDDHDICDGWGSHPRGLQESAVGRALFSVAREAFVLFQLGGADGMLPPTCLDGQGRTLSHAARFPGFSLILPDLRSERTPERVMGDAGWRAVEGALAGMPDGERRFVISSVPTLGPRLSLIEALLDFYPGLQKYEDDLRDQWQSRAHRDEWRRWLALLERQSTSHGAAVTVVSGEIHLAARAMMRFSNGEVLHQLVASGITHPAPPKFFPRGLALLSRFGESPLEGRPIRIRPLPGKTGRYTAERNYLVLQRRAGLWTAEWELEESGRTMALAI